MHNSIQNYSSSDNIWIDISSWISHKRAGLYAVGSIDVHDQVLEEELLPAVSKAVACLSDVFDEKVLSELQWIKDSPEEFQKMNGVRRDNPFVNYHHMTTPVEAFQQILKELEDEGDDEDECED